MDALGRVARLDHASDGGRRLPAPGAVAEQQHLLGAGAVPASVGAHAAELVEARDELSAEAQFEEFGDLMFVMANLGRHLGIEPEAALRAANAKFTRRFAGVEAKLAARGKTPAQSDLAEMDALWDAVKADERA